MRNRKGFALAAALLAVVLIGVLVGGVLFAATEETKAGAIASDREIALDACEAAIATAITDAGLRLPDSIGVGGTISNHSGELGPEIIVYITRLDSALYTVLAESVPELGSAGGAHRIGIVGRSSVAADGSITIDPISERPWFEVF
ncbi:MAG TPA: hypothetical protein VGO33_02440 [Gemmatimonadaceae bacterium]|jgi:Tfp pilus assembly protein PilX|nr:hypothetical protein [Gemmatimonadaceae bacterium]